MRELLTQESELKGTSPSSPSQVVSNDILSGFQSFRSRIRRYAGVYGKRAACLGLCAAVGLSLYSYVAVPAAVQVIRVNTVQTTETLGATGKIRGEKSADLGLDSSGVVRHMYVREGDRVTAGAPLLSVDTSALDARIDASQAGVATAQAELAKAARGALPSEMEQARAELRKAESVGRARITQSQARLADLQSGARSQEVAAAQAELRRHEAILRNAQSDYNRTKSLVEQGALPRAKLDQATTELEMARAAVAAQKEQISLLKAGSRPEQIAQAKAALTEAQASRDTSVRAAREKLNTLLALPRPEDVAAARARVRQAQAQLRQDHAVRAKTELRAPFDGVVADILVEQGQSVSPGQNLIAFQEIGRPVVQVETDEENLGVLAPGMKAVVTSGAYPGKSFDAVLYDLGSEVDSERGTITIKLRPTTQVTWLRPDLTVDVNIITETGARRIILPPDTVTRADGEPAVLVVKNGQTEPVKVTTGAVGPDGVVVFGELADGDRVVRNASDVEPHDAVRVTRES